jgi:hypothetical protein
LLIFKPRFANQTPAINSPQIFPHAYLHNDSTFDKVTPSMLTKSKILEILKKIQPQLKSKYGVRRLALFGSYATGTARERSDVDLLVELDRPIGFKFFRRGQSASTPQRPPGPLK